jgi:hypothetical protein
LWPSLRRKWEKEKKTSLPRKATLPATGVLATRSVSGVPIRGKCRSAGVVSRHSPVGATAALTNRSLGAACGSARPMGVISLRAPPRSAAVGARTQRRCMVGVATAPTRTVIAKLRRRARRRAQALRRATTAASCRDSSLAARAVTGASHQTRASEPAAPTRAPRDQRCAAPTAPSTSFCSRTNCQIPRRPVHILQRSEWWESESEVQS